MISKILMVRIFLISIRIPLISITIPMVSLMAGFASRAYILLYKKTAYTHYTRDTQSGCYGCSGCRIKRLFAIHYTRTRHLSKS